MVKSGGGGGADLNDPARYKGSGGSAGGLVSMRSFILSAAVSEEL